MTRHWYKRRVWGTLSGYFLIIILLAAIFLFVSVFVGIRFFLSSSKQSPADSAATPGMFGTPHPDSAPMFIGSVDSIDKDSFTIAIPTPIATTTLMIKITSGTRFYRQVGDTRTLAQLQQDTFANDKATPSTRTAVPQYSVVDATFADLRVRQHVTVHIATSTSEGFGYAHASEVDISVPRR